MSKDLRMKLLDVVVPEMEVVNSGRVGVMGSRLMDVVEDHLLSEETLDRVGKILHIFGCVPDCDKPHYGWRENARIILQEALDGSEPKV